MTLREMAELEKLLPPDTRPPTLDTALSKAAEFDPWETIKGDDDSLLSPEQFSPPVKPPDDSAYAILPDGPKTTPWSRSISTGETTGEHNAFRHYVALGSRRTLNKVATDLSIAYSTVTKLASDHNWVSRAAAWDSYQDEQYEKALVDSIKEMAERHAHVFSNALSGLSAAFKPFSDPEIIAAELEMLPVQKRMQLAIQAAKAMPGIAAAERLALGMPTEIKSESTTHTVRYEATLVELKGVLQGLVEADVTEKISSRDKNPDVIDVEAVEE